MEKHTSDTAVIIYEELLKNKGKMVPDNQLVEVVFGNKKDFERRFKKIQTCVSTKIRKFAAFDGFKIVRTTGTGYCLAIALEDEVQKEVKKKRKKNESFFVYDNERDLDFYDTIENLSLKLELKVETIRAAEYHKRWCNRRYYFRLDENDPIPFSELRIKSTDKTPTFQTYSEKIKVAAQSMEDRNEKYIQIDRKTRVLFRQKNKKNQQIF